jgi:hypothetical protein
MNAAVKIAFRLLYRNKAVIPESGDSHRPDKRELSNYTYRHKLTSLFFLN